MRAQAAGFTLIELLIALVLATAISVALVIAFRIGLQYVERGQHFYSTVQENFAVVNLLRQQLAAEMLENLRGDEDTSIRFVTKSKLGSVTRGRTSTLMLRCSPDEEVAGYFRLEQLPILPVTDTEADKAAQRVAPAEDQKTVLLDGLIDCGFAYLAKESDAKTDNAPAPAGAAAAPAKAAQPATGTGTSTASATAAAQDTAASWTASWPRSSKPLAMRLHVATREQELPPIVFPLVN